MMMDAGSLNDEEKRLLAQIRGLLPMAKVQFGYVNRDGGHVVSLTHDGVTQHHTRVKRQDAFIDAALMAASIAVSGLNVADGKDNLDAKTYKPAPEPEAEWRWVQRQAGMDFLCIPLANIEDYNADMTEAVLGTVRMDVLMSRHVEPEIAAAVQEARKSGVAPKIASSLKTIKTPDVDRESALIVKSLKKILETPSGHRIEREWSGVSVGEMIDLDKSDETLDDLNEKAQLAAGLAKLDERITALEDLSKVAEAKLKPDAGFGFDGTASEEAEIQSLKDAITKMPGCSPIGWDADLTGRIRYVSGGFKSDFHDRRVNALRELHSKLRAAQPLPATKEPTLSDMMAHLASPSDGFYLKRVGGLGPYYAVAMLGYEYDGAPTVEGAIKNAYKATAGR